MSVKKTIRGVRDTIPAGYLMGRIAGNGPAQLIRVAAIRKLGSPNLGVQAISELTGDVTAGPGSGSQAATIANGAVTEAKQTLADNTTWNASTARHGYLKKLSNAATDFINGLGAWTPVKLAVFTVAGLPSAATVGTGSLAIVTDALTPVLGGVVVGAGAVRVIVNSDGTDWRVG